jgi:chaperonin GroEL (HSP60 family)
MKKSFIQLKSLISGLLDVLNGDDNKHSPNSFSHTASKHLMVGDDARKKLTDALELISMAVEKTLGPGGRPFGFDKLGADMRLSASFTKDGLTVLKALAFNDPVLDSVLQYCKQASSNSVLASGDGPQPLHSKILTPKGFIPMSEVRVGMEICGTDGTIQTVLGVFPKGEKEIYEVEFHNSGIVECCADHLWEVTDTFRTVPKKMIITTGEMLTKYTQQKFHPRENRSYPCFRYYTPRTAVEFYNNEAEMPLDSYLVGVLLGDGSLSGTGSIELSLGDKKEHIINKLKLPKGVKIESKYVDNKNSYRVKFTGVNDQKRSIMYEIMESIGLLGTRSDSKFIPKSYLYSSIENRKALLQGLLDTDGHLNSKGLYEFSTISHELATDVVDLFKSLGKAVKIYRQDRTETDGSYSMKPIYRIIELEGFKYGNKIVRITPTGKTVPMQCIKVSNSDSLYITDNYIATHNTSSTLVLANAVSQAIMNSQNGKVPQQLARIIEAEAKAAIAAIRAEAIKDEDTVKYVAMTSSNGDEELTNVVLEAIKQSSAYGTLVVEKAPASSVRYKISKQDGYSNCSGYNYNNTLALSASTNGEAAASRAIEWENPYVLLFNGNLHMPTQIDPIINVWSASVAQNPKSLVVVCYEVSDEVCNKLLVVNRQAAKHGVGVMIIKPRLTAETYSALQVMRDLAAFCGIKENLIVDGGNFKDLSQDFFGTCGKISIGQTSTAFLGRNKNHWVTERIQQNQSIVENARSEFDRQITAIRNAELSEGLVKVEIGGGLLPDLQERADRFDDASKAAQSCMKHGALPGCGVSYIRAGKLAGVGPELTEAFKKIHATVLLNYGVDPKFDYPPQHTVRIDSNGITEGHVSDVKVYDACETVCAAIQNGVSLGIQVAIAGGYSYRPRRMEDDPEQSYGSY